MISSGSFQSDVYWNLFIFYEIKIRPWQMKMDPVYRIIFIESPITEDLSLWYAYTILINVFQSFTLFPCFFCKISTAINSFLKYIFIVFRNYFSLFRLTMYIIPVCFTYLKFFFSSQTLRNRLPKSSFHYFSESRMIYDTRIYIMVTRK